MSFELLFNQIILKINKYKIKGNLQNDSPKTKAGHHCVQLTKLKKTLLYLKATRYKPKWWKCIFPVYLIFIYFFLQNKKHETKKLTSLIWEGGKPLNKQGLQYLFSFIYMYKLSHLNIFFFNAQYKKKIWQNHSTILPISNHCCSFPNILGGGLETELNFNT